MSEEIRLWRVGQDHHLSELQHTFLSLEEHLQEWLAKDISILDPNLLVIGREVKTDYGGYIDLLCMDPGGNLVVVELKRDKTPREIVAQVLEYGSWVAELSNERVTTIAETYFRDSGFALAFREKYANDVPETLNSDHRMLVVGARIDERSERIIKYLSDKHGVNINAATFQFFRTHDGGEFLARIFLIEPSVVEQKSFTSGSSKRRPNLSYEDLAKLAEDLGVQSLYQHAVSVMAKTLQKHTTRSSIGFTGVIDGGRKNVISLLPGESSSTEGLKYQLYANRFSILTGLANTDLELLVPESHENWIYYPSAGADYEGFQGFIKSHDEIDRLAKALSNRKMTN